MEDTRLVVFKLSLLFLYVFLLFLLVFFFRGRSIISSIFFQRRLPIQQYLSDGHFCHCLPTERVFTEQVVRISP